MPLQIYDERERRLVGIADRALSVASAIRGLAGHRRPTDRPRRILLLRLERIGDLLMTLPAIAELRELAPRAEIDLVVGSWNLELANAVKAVSRVEALDARWLARGAGGMGLASLVLSARRWRARRYDLAINFEPDIRSNLLVAASGARWTVGYASGGGGPALDCALEYDPRSHTADNASRLIAAVFGRRSAAPYTPSLTIPDSAKRAAAARLAAAPGPMVGVHVSGGRAIKQWDASRFGEVAGRLAAETGATIILTGTADDRPLVDVVKRALTGRRVIDLAGDVDLVTLAALLERLDLFLTGDTGPMHLAAAVGTPVVAIFGPSDPVRYAPRGAADRIVRVDLPCSPCNRIRLPPERCLGHTPDCLALVSAARVFDAAMSVLSSSDTMRRARAGGA
jgi:ADP-heptose:LPS heptosyltransferase